MPPDAAQPTPNRHDQPTQSPDFFAAAHFQRIANIAVALDSSMYRSFSKKENGFPHSQPSNRFYLRKILTTAAHFVSHQKNRENQSV
jgi:hypothetical protein